MMINNGTLALKKICHKLSIRPTLAGIYFDKNKAVVTDSYCLIEIENLEENKSEFISPEEPIMVPIKTLDLIKIPKNEFQPELNNAFITGSPDFSEKTIKIIDNQNKIDINFIEMDNKFIDYKQFLTLDKQNLSIGIGVDVLEKVLEVYKKNGCNNIKFQLGGPLDPIGLFSEDSKKIIKSVIMPFKLD